ncbi:MAG: Calx-beta domain-containing protein [Kiritimatiellia bacterium]
MSKRRRMILYALACVLCLLAVPAFGGITYVGVSTADGNKSVAVAVPGGVQDDDVMIAHISSKADKDITVVPSDWTEIFESADVDQVSFHAYYKVASGESGSYTWESDDSLVGIIVAYRNVSTSDPVDAWAVADGNGGTGNPDPPQITTSIDGCMILAMAANVKKDTTYTEPSGFTERYDRASNQDINGTGADKLQSSAGAIDPGVFDSSIDDKWAAGTLGLKPAVAEPVVTNAAASGVGTATATLNGGMQAGGSTDVYIYWGTNDAGEVKANWNSNEYLGTLANGPFSTNLTGLIANRTYYYRCYATNSVGEDWATNSPTPVVFTTAMATVQFALTNSGGAESVTSTNLAITLSEASGADMTVQYSVTGGTADGGGVDYTLPAGTATITVGNVSGTIGLSIVDDAVYEGDETIIVALSNATGAVLGSYSNHTYTILCDDPEMGLLGTNGAAIADNDTSPQVADGTDYGEVVYGGSPKDHTFTITNTGAANLILTGTPTVVFGGTHSGDFSVAGSLTTNIVAGSNAFLTIRFTPGAEGARTGTVSIANNDGAADPYNWTVKGTGTAGPEAAAPTNLTQATDGSGLVQMETDIDHGDDNDVEFRVEYSVDGGSTWTNAWIDSIASVDYGAAPGIDNSATYQVGTNSAYVKTTNGANTVTFKWDTQNAGNGESTITTGYVSTVRIRLRPYDGSFPGSWVTSASDFTVDNKAPVISQAIHFETAPTAGDTSFALDAAFTEDSPYTNVYGYKLNGAGSYTYAGGDTNADPAAVTFNVTLDGDDYFNAIMCVHTDDFGNVTTSEDTSSNYVCPLTNPAPAVVTQTMDSIEITINTNASQTGSGILYAVKEAGGQYVQADGTLGGSEVWQTLAAWGTNIVVTNLSAGTTYTFSTSAGNPSDAAPTIAENSASAYSAAAAGTTDGANVPDAPSGTAWLCSTQLVDGTTDVNVGTPADLELTFTAADGDYYEAASWTASNLTVKADGDYLVHAALPMGPASVERSCVQLQVYTNGVGVPGGVGESSYIRALDGHAESSDHVSVLVPGLSSNDTISVRVKGTAASGTVDMGQGSLFVEYIAGSRKVFAATAADNAAGNINNATASGLQWTSYRKDAGAFTHTDGQTDITLADAGGYLVYVNIPVYSAVARSGPKVMVRLDGATVSGGVGRQGYIRALSGHNDASVHWFGLIQAAAGQVLTLETQADAAAGTVSVQSGLEASLYVERVNTNSGWYAGRGTTVVTGGTDWNGSATPRDIQWSADDVIDSMPFAHTNSNEIVLKRDGDYLVTYNDSLYSAAARPNVKITLAADGTALTGAEAKSHYIRAADGHNNSSACLLHFLNNVSSGTRLTLRAAQEAQSGSVTAAEDAKLTVRWFDPGYPIIENEDPTGITTSSAWLNGNLAHTGTAQTAVYVFWGDTDGTTNKSSWGTNVLVDANASEGTVQYQPTDLTADTTYYYRYYASNSYGVSWADASKIFISGEITATATDSTAVEGGEDTGTIRISRPVTATNEPLAVYYTCSGTASNGVDYLELSGSVTMAAGESNAFLTISAILDLNAEGNETATITLSSGLYAIGSPSQADVTISDVPYTQIVWDNDDGDELASNPNNWDPDGVPTDADLIVLNGTCTDNMTWDTNATNVVGGWFQDAGYTGTVTIETTCGNYGGTFTNLTIDGGCTISNGVWTHLNNNDDTAAPWLEHSRLRLTVNGNLVVGANAGMNATGRGYQGGQGPGGTLAYTTSSKYRTSASHGGLGSSLAPVYGSVTKPENIGSGGEGGNSTSADTRGGGAIYLDVAGRTTVEAGAVIQADGLIHNYGAGSGGSVYIETGSIEGGGMVRADGGSSESLDYTYDGGGGRVAVVLTDTDADFSLFTGTARAYSGSNSVGKECAAGTVYLQTGAQTDGEGTLIVKNNDYTASEPYTTLMPDGFDISVCSEVIVKEKGRLAIDDDNPLTWDNLNLTGSGYDASYFTVSGDALVTYPDTVTVQDYTLMADGISKTLTNVVVATNGVISHTQGDGYKINMTLAGDLTVEAGGSIDVQDKGGTGNPGDSMADYIGGSHGGLGADSTGSYDPNPTYGSWLTPTNQGSHGNTGGARGGGVIVLDVAGTTTVEPGGTISAHGDSSLDGGDGLNGGSGGSVWLTTSNLLGAGNINADGASAANPRCGGGGGRIAVYLTGAGAAFHSFTNSGGVIQAIGGDGSSSKDAAAGTVYLEEGNDGSGGGTVYIYNADRTPLDGQVTHMPASYAGGNPEFEADDDLTNAVLHVRSSGNVNVTAESHIGDLFLDSGCNLKLDYDLYVYTNEHELDGGVEGPGQIIWLAENWGPVALATNMSLTLDAGGEATITANDLDDGSYDRDTGPSNLVISIDTNYFTSEDIGQNAVVLTADDGALTHSITVTVTVVGYGSMIWTGNGADELASNSNNWSLLRVPTNTDCIVIDGTTGANPDKDMTWDQGSNGLPDTVSIWQQTENYTGTVTFATMYPGQGSFTNFTVSSNMFIHGGTVTHQDLNNDSSAPWVETHRLALTVGELLEIDGDGSIDVTGLGFNNDCGPGASLDNYESGGYGGYGYSDDDGEGQAYGVIISPTNCGSGGTWSPGYGGGAVKLTAGTLSVLGTNVCITAKGGDTTSAGSGGSIYITAGSLTGTGTIAGSGGDGDSWRGGSGGRIGIFLTNSAARISDIQADLQACSGEGDRGLGGAGTVYLEDPSHVSGQGELVIDNNNMESSLSTTKHCPLCPDANDSHHFAKLTVRDYSADGGHVTLVNDITVDDILIEQDGYISLVTNGDYTITVNTYEHHLDDPTQSGPGSTNLVDQYSNILWLGPVAPEIQNQSATGVTASTAWLNAYLSEEGQDTAYVYAFWGTSDGGTIKGDWTTNEYLGAETAGDVTEKITNLTGGVEYFFRFYASNSLADAWATNTLTFIPEGEVTIQATDPVAEEGGDGGTFTVYRPATATSGALVVNFTISGTATETNDYTLDQSGGSVTIPAGCASAAINVSPVDDMVTNEPTETVILTLAEGGYAIGSPSNATVSILENDSGGTDFGRYAWLYSTACGTGGQPMTWSTNTINTAVFSVPGGADTNITVLETGDYFIALTLPLTGTRRFSTIRAEVYTNGMLAAGAHGESSCLYTETSHKESSDHFGALLQLQSNDTIQVRTDLTSSHLSGDNPTVDGRASLYIEKIGSSRTVFAAHGTDNDAGDINSDGAMVWDASIRQDSGFTFTGGNTNITLDSAGYYVVYVNIPLNNSGDTDWIAPRMSVKLDGAVVPGGYGQQGFMRGDIDVDHDNSSTHWSGVVCADNPNQEMTIATLPDETTGAASVQSGRKASIYIEKLDTPRDMFISRGWDLTGGTNWNPSSRQTVEWEYDYVVDPDTFIHSTNSNPHQITVRKAGNYLLTYNDALTSKENGVNPSVQVLVDGTEVTGAECRSHYIHNGSLDHAHSSGSLVFMLTDLSVGSVITVTTEKEANGGHTDDEDDAMIFIEYKPFSITPLTVNNANGATAVTESSATLNGQMTGADNYAYVYVYWGDNDGGTNFGSLTWDHVEEFGWSGGGMFATNITSDIYGGREYFYQFYASNTYEQVWAPNCTNFWTPASTGDRGWIFEFE